MCTNFVASTRQEIAAQRLGVAQLPAEQWPDEVFPGYSAPLVRRDDSAPAAGAAHSMGADGSGQPAVCEVARFGLVPPWCRDAAHAAAVSRGTYNCRSETAPEKPSFRAAWRQRQWALVPMSSFFEPCWETGRSVRWQLTDGSQQPFAVAGLWEQWRDPLTGQHLRSVTLLTVNADQHPLMSRMHRPGEEKRMLVLVGSSDYAYWLQASNGQALEVLRAAAQQPLCGQPAPRAAKPTGTATSESPDAPRGPSAPTQQNLSLF